MVESLTDIFGTQPHDVGGKFEITYGAMKRLAVWVGEGERSLCVESESRSDVPDEVILDTNRRFRQYLEKVTGYTAKERVKMAKKMEED
ncbi:MAG: DUF5611 family protein [Methanomicrobiales archaeon]|nr:DUF5611 family protein [Methanomicrobiales archaeon]